MKRKLLLSAFVIGMFFSVAVDAQQWKKDLKEFLTNGQRNPATAAPIELTSVSPSEALEFVSTYLQDSIFDVRIKALELTHHVAIASNDTVARRRGVQLLVSSIIDIEMTGQALSMLTRFTREDFSESSRKVISQHIEQKNTYLNELMRIAGYLRLTNLRPVIGKYVLPGNAGTTRWAALISLSRMGDVPATSEIMARVERLPVNDDVVYDIFPDLIFTRQERPIAYMVQAMHRSEKNCFTADAEREVPIPCTFRIAEQLAEVIEGFPLSVDKSGDLIVADGAAAIESLRNWFDENPKYKILDDNY